jgi:hypothetical protein
VGVGWWVRTWVRTWVWWVGVDLVSRDWVGLDGFGSFVPRLSVLMVVCINPPLQHTHKSKNQIHRIVPVPSPTLYTAAARAAANRGGEGKRPRLLRPYLILLENPELVRGAC